MQYVGKLVSSVYNTITPNINPSTLNGAIDVIVVERECEVEEKVTQEDSTERIVKRKTTELAATPFHVRFGKMSVLRPDERKVTLHLNDSPEALPFAMKVGENGEAFFVMKIDDMPGDVPQALMTSPIVGSTDDSTLRTEPEPLDLGASETSSPALDPGQTEAPEELAESDLAAMRTSKDMVKNVLDMDGYKMTKNKQEQALREGKRFADEMPLSRRHGGVGKFGFRERLDRKQSHWHKQSFERAVHDSDTFKHSRRASDSSVHAPDLDRDAPRTQEAPPRLPISISDSALLHSSRYMYEVPRGGPASDASVPPGTTPAVLGPAQESELGELACAESDPYLFQLRLDNYTPYTFELSLCNTGASSTQGVEFDEARVSFQRFAEDASIIDDPRLCIRHNATYHVRSTDPDMFATLALYRNVQLQTDKTSAGKSETKPSVWSRLWSPRTEPVQTPIVKSKSVLVLPAQDKDTADVAEEAPAAAQPRTETYAKTLRLTSDQLKQLGLRKGANNITFSVTSSFSGLATCRARVFLWDSKLPVVVSDIDGTITKSDALGHVFTLMGRDWTHLGVAKLYHDIAQNGYRIMYLTSRAIGQAELTRDYLANIDQNNYRLPDGPVIMSPDRLMASLHREVILRKPEVFKMACLRDIARLFGMDPSAATQAQTMEPSMECNTPFYSGFGNRITDALSYRSVNIPSSRIFTIDANGEVKMELLELAGYKSSYPNMTDLVDQMFPPIAHDHGSKSNAFTDFVFWRGALQDIELPPDHELLPDVPSSPIMRGLRSPRNTSGRASPASLPQGTPEPPAQERPSRFRRFGFSRLGLRRKKDTDEGPRSLDATYTSTDPLASPPEIASPLASSFDTERELSTSAELEEALEVLAENNCGEQRERARSVSPSTIFPSLHARARKNEEKKEDIADEPFDLDDDPVLAAGDIQFEWRG
ncbi:phosphatidate phosphatase [Malassezia vespertilionis]|nr:phosphatidate phosphatase [Malassezia vespertilionis]WFD06256.1 phosphatidate phosphatase [Malassezia vespertilionis]